MGRGRAQKSIELVQQAREILEAIQPASIRAVCYQLFVRGAIPGMEKKYTNRVSDLLARARESDEIPWEWVVQEGRAIEGRPTWDSPADYAQAVQASYRLNKWQGQPKRILVVSEKGTVRGTLAPVLAEYEVDFLPVGGYASATRVKNLAELANPDQPALVLYLGDHDPSGRGMSDQDLPRRLLRYASDRPDVRWKAAVKDVVSGASAENIAAWSAARGLSVRRIAVTETDGQALGNAVSFPAADKRKDSRYAWFVRTFGTRCWELDAMNPNDLRARVRAAVVAELDRPAWDRYVAAEKAERDSITKTLETWKAISGLVRE